MKLYGRRRQYQRLRSNGVSSESENDRISISKAANRRRFVWRVRVSSKLRVRLSKSMATLRRFRDSYVEMMFCFAGRFMQLNNGNVHLVKKISTSQFHGYRTRS